MEYNADDIATLGAKLDALELNHGERLVLDAILTRDDEVSGFASPGYGLKIGGLLDVAIRPYYDGAGNHIMKDPISSGDLGSGRRGE